MLCYTSREAYNSCLSLFPNISSRQLQVADVVTCKEIVKESRLAQLKQQRALRFEEKTKKNHGLLPLLQAESHADIIENKHQYMDDAPSYKATSNSKLNFQSRRQLEFEVNPDIDVLHQMFPSVGLQTIYMKYQACSESLHATIEILLATPETDSSLPDIQDEGMWPRLPSPTVIKQKILPKAEVGENPDSESNSVMVINNFEPKEEGILSLSETESVSDIDFDVVLVASRSNSICSANTDISDNSSSGDNEWILLQEGGYSPDDDSVVISHIDTNALANRSEILPFSFSYKDILLIE